MKNTTSPSKKDEKSVTMDSDASRSNIESSEQKQKEEEIKAPTSDKKITIESRNDEVTRVISPNSIDTKEKAENNESDIKPTEQQISSDLDKRKSSNNLKQPETDSALTKRDHP